MGARACLCSALLNFLFEQESGKVKRADILLIFSCIFVENTMNS
jgi:hypothetical protein